MPCKKIEQRSNVERTGDWVELSVSEWSRETLVGRLHLSAGVKKLPVSVWEKSSPGQGRQM